MAKFKSSQIEETIHLHGKWRRQFFNAFAGGNYADMPLSEHRSCTLAGALEAHNAPPELIALHLRFHALANEITTLSQNGLGDAADLLLPELSENAHQLAAALDQLRD
ncbi:hypothetical protein [Azonexus sp.]|uniref:hypothetical protein n=1 Tax=Azonexus sp. TaxID=1872668 RepID=UPI0039E32721